MSDTNKAVVRRLIEAFNAGDLSVIDELVASNYVYREPMIGERHGRQGSKDITNTYRTGFPDAKMTIDEQIAVGDTVVTRWTGTGTHTGPLLGLPPTGRRVTVTGIRISHLRDGKVIEDFENYDTLGMMRQLGVIPAAVGKAA
jgi:steroid delta-isomerase-like uncharacterized protein